MFESNKLTLNVTNENHVDIWRVGGKGGSISLKWLTCFIALIGHSHHSPNEDRFSSFIFLIHNLKILVNFWILIFFIIFLCCILLVLIVGWSSVGVVTFVSAWPHLDSENDTLKVNYHKCFSKMTFWPIKSSAYPTLMSHHSLSHHSTTWTQTQTLVLFSKYTEENHHRVTDQYS